MAQDSNSAAQSAPPIKLARAIGASGSVAIIVGSIIGSGIFLVPHNVATQVGSSGALLWVWIVGGVLALAGSLSLAELGASIPEAGGLYVYLREAYGKLFAFLFGWASLLVVESGAVATLAVAFSLYGATFFPLTPLEQKMISTGTIALLMGVNILGVREGTAVQKVFTLAKLLGLAVIILAAIFAHPSATTAPLPPPPTPHTSFATFGIALIGVLWAYQGWHTLSYSAGEVRDPSRVLPRSYLIGTLIIVAVYLGANLAYLHVLPLAAIAQHQRVAASAMEIVIGPRGAAFVSALILCSIFGATNGNILAPSRIYYAMARDKVFFSAVGRVHPRCKTPAVAVAIHCLWAMVLASSGSFEQLFTYVIFTGWIFYGAAALAVVVLRFRQPALPRPYRVPGYPILPLAFTAAAIAILGNTLISKPIQSLLGLGVVLTGIPVYYLWKLWLGHPPDDSNHN